MRAKHKIDKRIRKIDLSMEARESRDGGKEGVE